MQPIKFTARGLRRIALTASLDRSRPHLCALRFRPSDVLATDGTMLVRVPLPHDPERDFVLPSVPTVEALRALRRDITVTLNRGAVETRLSAPLGYDFAISDDADISVDRYPSVEVVIDATQKVGTVADAHLSARMWIRVGRLARDLISVGDRHRDDAPIRILKAGSIKGGGGRPAHLAFTTAHGDALAVVMPVRK